MFINTILSINSHINNYHRSGTSGSEAGGIIFLLVMLGAILLFINASKRQALDNKRANKKFDNDDFTNILLLLSAAVIKADGRIYKKEKDLLKQELRKDYSAYLVSKFMADLDICLKKRIRTESICKAVLLNYNKSEKIQLMNFLISLTTSNGKLTDNEYFTLTKIAQKIGMSKSKFNSLLAMFKFERIGDFKKKSKQSHKKTNNTKTTYSSLSKAYQILEIDNDADVDEIKKAYRKLAKIHHPDRVIHLGKEHQKSAKERFQKISNAYELIKSKKKFA